MPISNYSTFRCLLAWDVPFLSVFYFFFRGTVISKACLVYAKDILFCKTFVVFSSTSLLKYITRGTGGPCHCTGEHTTVPVLVTPEGAECVLALVTSCLCQAQSRGRGCGCWCVMWVLCKGAADSGVAGCVSVLCVCLGFVLSFARRWAGLQQQGRLVLGGTGQ